MEDPFAVTKRTGRPLKLDERAERRLVRHMASNPFDSLTCLSTPGKTGCRIHFNTTRKYAQDAGLNAYKARKKPFINKKQAQKRLRFARMARKLDDEDLQMIA